MDLLAENNLLALQLLADFDKKTIVKIIDQAKNIKPTKKIYKSEKVIKSSK